jgi:hypothetical protein
MKPSKSTFLGPIYCVLYWINFNGTSSKKNLLVDIEHCFPPSRLKMISNKITIGNIWYDFMDESFQHAIKLVKDIVRHPQ